MASERLQNAAKRLRKLVLEVDSKATERGLGIYNGGNPRSGSGHLPQPYCQRVSGEQERMASALRKLALGFY